jgi:hypothetical protein
MTIRVRIIGVHSITADEPVHLIELLVEGDFDEFDIGEITQEIPDQPRMNWQAAYDERVLEKSKDKVRYAFFFHYLRLDKPLQTSSGPLALPRPTKMPTHLQDIQYEAP